MMKNTTRTAKAAIASTLAAALMLGTTSASASPVVAQAPAPTYAASAAFAVAAQDAERQHDASPEAIPAVVGTAFIAGAAAGAGKVVAGWAAKKVIGRWSIEPELSHSMLD